MFAEPTCRRPSVTLGRDAGERDTSAFLGRRRQCPLGIARRVGEAADNSTPCMDCTLDALSKHLTKRKPAKEGNHVPVFFLVSVAKR